MFTHLNLGGSHCSELYAYNATEPEDLSIARKKISDLIGGILKGKI